MKSGIAHNEHCWTATRLLVTSNLCESRGSQIHRYLAQIFVRSVAVRCFCLQECFCHLDTQARIICLLSSAMTITERHIRIWEYGKNNQRGRERINKGQIAKKPITLVLQKCCRNGCENLLFFDLYISTSPPWRVHGHVSPGAWVTTTTPRAPFPHAGWA